MSPSDPSHNIYARIRRAKVRLAAGEFLAGSVWIAAGVAAMWLLATAAESIYRFSTAGRTALLIVFLIGAFVMIGRYAMLPVLRFFGLVPGLSNDAVATRIGAAFPEIRDRLLNLLQLLDGRHTESTASLVDEASRVLGRSMSTIPVERVEDFSAVWKAGRLATLPIVGLLAFALLAREPFLDASTRILAPRSTFEVAVPYSLRLLPGDVSVAKGSNVDIRASVSGTGFPEELVLEFRYEGESVSESVAMSSPPEAAYSLVNVRRALQYRVLAGRVVTDWFQVSVIDRPVVAELAVALSFPAYTRLPARQLAHNDGTVTALIGTQVILNSVVTGTEVASGSILFSSGREVALSGAGRSWEGRFRVRQNDMWKMDFQSSAGISNANPIEYRLRATPDEPPSISFLAPEPSVELDESARVDVAWRITDDYGFSEVSLHYRLEESRFGEPSDSFSVMALPLDDAYQLDQTGTVNWRLVEDTGLDPVPGDVYTYFLRTSDNNAVGGFSSAQTALYRLRMPSLAERYEALDRAEDDTQDHLEELVEEANRVREQFDALREELRSKSESEWQDERALEELKEEQEALEDSVEEMADRIEAMTDEMAKNDLVSEETLELFEELKQVADEISTPELMEALDSLQEAMEQMNLQQMQESMEDFEFAENLYQQRMERTLELFKNLRVQQDLEEAARRAEDLAETEEEIAQRTEPLATDPDMSEEDRAREAEALAAQQEAAAEEMAKLEEKMEEISDRMDELERTPDQAMDELSDDIRDQDMPSEMRENAEQMRKQEFQPAQQQQQQMSENLRKLQQDLEQMQQSMQGGQMQMNMNGLRQALDDVLGLSIDQEKLRSEVQTLAADSPRLRETAQQQLRLSEGLTTVTDSLQSLARTIPQMGRDVQVHAGESMREMADATKAMTDRTARRAAGHQKGAMTHLNELALMLADLLDQMMNGQGSGGNMSMEQMMQQLQDMAGQQEQLNQQLQQMLNDMQGNRLTQDMQDRLRRLGGQQEQIRRDLRQMSRERSLRNRALGDLERVAEQMAETIAELQQQRISRRTVQRQQQILTRLLEASRSMQERGRERRRESQSADQFTRIGPDALSPTEQAHQLRRDLIRALEQGYAPDYEDLIRRYFDLLGQQESPQKRD